MPDMRMPNPWVMLFALAMLPWLLLAGLGAFWLWQQGQLLPCLWLATAFYGLLWIVLLWFRKRQTPTFSELPSFQPGPLASPAAEAAWAKVEKIANTLDREEYSLGCPDKLLPLARRIIVEVAKRFNPTAEAAELDVPLPSILLIIERVSRDIREMLSEQVPGSHLISVQDGLILLDWKKNLEKLGIIGAAGRLLVSPALGLAYELRMVFFNRVTRYSLAELERWLLHTLVRKLGYYAILLYSGELGNGVYAGKRSSASARDMENAKRLEESRFNEPLRILVAGQTKSGKSSLINALFGELRAPADALPSTNALVPYMLEPGGEFLGIVLDSPGYGEHISWVEDNRTELHKIDLVLLACSATHAGRAADSVFLQTLRTQYGKTPDRIPPPIIVALTHIDRLRPVREWKPPYNIDHASGIKERQIRSCMEEIARTLAIPLEQVQAVCLKPNEEWNIEAVWSIIAAQLPLARRAQYLRCLKDRRAREKWEMTLRQMGKAGRLIVGGIFKSLALK